MKVRNDFLYLVSSQCYRTDHDHYHRHAHVLRYQRPAAKIQSQSLVTEGNSWLYEFSQRHVSMSVSSTCVAFFSFSLKFSATVLERVPVVARHMRPFHSDEPSQHVPWFVLRNHRNVNFFLYLSPPFSNYLNYNISILVAYCFNSTCTLF